MAVRSSPIKLSLRSIDTSLTRLIAGVAAAALLSWAGTRVARRRLDLESQLKRADATLATFEDWRRKYEPAVAAESISWRRTMMELHGLGVIGDERLQLAQSVARAAEAAGLRDVRVLIEQPDTTGGDRRPSTGGVGRKAAGFSLQVDCRGSLRAVAGFLGQLPASVAPVHMMLARQDGRSRHRFSLAVYELTFENGLPPYWTSLERDDSGRSGRPRSGG